MGNINFCSLDSKFLMHSYRADLASLNQINLYLSRFNWLNFMGLGLQKKLQMKVIGS